MKMRSEEDTEEQIQELKTITRLQGEPCWVTEPCWVPPPPGALLGDRCHPRTGLGLPRAGLSISINVGTVQANGLGVALLPTPPN